MPAELLESTSERLSYKFYATATIDPTVEAVPATDPAVSGGQILRHVSHSLSLTKETYVADEIRQDLQRPMEQHGTRKVTGTINGLLSPSTQADLLEAVLGGTWSAAAITASNTELTSAAADSTTSKFTFAGGDPVAVGFHVGDIASYAGLSDTDNNGKNFLIMAFGGTTNREMTVYPAPDTMTADTSFTLTTVGRSLFMPASAHVKRKVALEVYNADGDIARLFTEGRFSEFDVKLAPNANATIDFTGMWRNRKVYTTTAAPFFTAPTAETTTEVLSSMDGLLVLYGAIVGVATGLSFKFSRASTGPAQLHRQGLIPGVLLANAIIIGEFTVFLQDTVFLDLFDDPVTLRATEFGILAYLSSSDDAAAEAMSFFLPRVKINSNTESVVDGAKAIQCGFTAARYLGTGAGIVSSSIRIVDTTVT